MKKYVFNHYYKLKHDLKRSYIISSPDSRFLKTIKLPTNWVSMIHPIYAMILSFFSRPITIDKAIAEIFYFLSIEDKEVKELIIKLINTDKIQDVIYGGGVSVFPIKLIIPEEEAFTHPQDYNPKEFSYKDIDLKTERCIGSPITLVYMINNKCATNCSYCYADTVTKAKPLLIQKLETIISDAAQLRIKDFIITGGEFFLYKDWEELMGILFKYNYKPDLISTKVPITESDIIRFKKYKTRIQISFDSMTPEISSSMLGVSINYVTQIINTIKLLDKHKLRYQIATVLTSENRTIDNLEKIYELVKNLKYLERWEIRVGFKSLYSKQDFDKLKINKDDVLKVGIWLENIMQKIKLNILWAPNDDKKYNTTDGGSRYFVGGRCSANMSNMVILPDGKVTVCEQLYWNKDFIIGDITHQSIEEVWRSKRALELYNVRQKDVSKQSPCESCKDFNDCFGFGNRCIADIVKAYGWDKSDYPDPRCNKAPKFIYNITHD